MIGTSDQSCWLAEACKILLLLLQPKSFQRVLIPHLCDTSTFKSVNDVAQQLVLMTQIGHETL